MNNTTTHYCYGRLGTDWDDETSTYGSVVLCGYGYFTMELNSEHSIEDYKDHEAGSMPEACIYGVKWGKVNECHDNEDGDDNCGLAAVSVLEEISKEEYESAVCVLEGATK